MATDLAEAAPPIPADPRTVGARLRLLTASPAAWFLGVATAAVVVCHYWALGTIAPGYFSDEGQITYAAWGIALDGRDEHGAAWPIFFESFGDWRSPLFVYLVAGAVRVFGPGIVVARAISSSLELLTAVLLGLIVWQAFRLRWLAWTTFLVAAVTPWLLEHGRVALETNALPPMLVLFLLLWLRADRRSSWIAAIAAGAVLGLTFYTYQTARLLVPLLMGALLLSELPRPRWRLLAGAWSAAALTLLPVLLFDHQHPGALTARFGVVSALADAHSPLEAASRVWRVYTSDLSPAFLFYQTWWIQGGQLFAELALPLALGLAFLWRSRRDRFWRLVAIGLLLSPVPAALTYDFGHELRAMDEATFLLLVMAAGVSLVAPLLTRERLLAGALAGVVAFQAVVFLDDYFTTYPSRIADWQEQGYEQAVAAASGYAHSHGSAIVISSHIANGDLLFAYFSREDLRLYRGQGIGGANASVVDIGHSPALPPGSVVIAQAGDAPPNATLLETVQVSSLDPWGRPTSRPVYRVWVTN